MAPSLDDGDLVLLRRYGRLRPARTGDVACIRRDDEPLLIKRLGHAARTAGSACRAMARPPHWRSISGVAADHAIVGRAVLRLSGNRMRGVRR